ncbi:Flp pilus assembly protein CpaB [Arenibaculum sp.]|jgi:pilus assembly protein CpaB|uniref:Flp pilus assembly protein CpaB n=1 Tax=Arenibaculum sp. TaxID=2865862 RepID=UPI002E0FD118|nr:Flp pilus assembly protein CpaB [Arenibaculum sp.]
MRSLVLAIVALAAAGGSAIVARDWLEAQREALLASVPVVEAPAERPATMVLVAAVDLPPGHFLQAGQLRWQAWPDEALSPAHIVQGQRPEEDFVGAVSRVPVLAGEPVTDARFVRPGERGFLAAVLERGMRAATVPITATSGNAGFVFPGDRVDLILTSRMNEGGDGRQFAVTVLESVRVLAIDQRLATQPADAAPGRTATLEVTQKMAEKVALAIQMGTLSLSLRSLGNDGDAEQPVEPATGPVPIVDRDLYLEVAPPPAPSAGGPMPVRRPTVVVLRGAEAREIEF